MPTTSDFGWWIKEKQIGIGEESQTTTDISAPGADVVIRYYGPRYADDFVEDAMQQESNIPRHLHRALAAHVLMEHYEEEGRYKDALVWEKIWNKKVRDGQAMAFKNKETGPILPRPQEY